MNELWSRAEQGRACKESHDIFPKELPLPRSTAFVASYEKEPPSIGLLLGWEYGRLWLKEHKQNMAKELKDAKPFFIDSDFSWWVNKRTAVIDRRQIFLKKRQNPHVKNCNLSAFAKSKTHRKKLKGGSIASTQVSTNTGSAQVGSALTSSPVSGLAMGGSIYTGSAHASSAHAGSTLAGSASVGSVPVGSAPAGSAKTGSAGASASASAGAIPLTYAEKAKICKCKECKERRGGGRETNLKQLSKYIPMPWY